MDIGSRIKKRRIEIGLTLKDIASALNIAESTVSRYESKDIQNMGIDKVKDLAEVLKCTPAYLMGWEETPSLLSGKDAIWLKKIHLLYPEDEKAVEEIVDRIIATYR